MKQPYPQPPKGAPEGTVWFGGPIRWFAISLNISGDELDPDRITQQLGTMPTYAQRKGTPIFRDDGTVKRIANTSVWALKLTPQDTDEWSVCEAIKILINKLPADAKLWPSIPDGCKASIRCALEITSFNKGFNIDPAVTLFAAERNVWVEFDIYSEEREE